MQQTTSESKQRIIFMVSLPLDLLNRSRLIIHTFLPRGFNPLCSTDKGLKPLGMCQLYSSSILQVRRKIYPLKIMEQEQNWRVFFSEMIIETFKHMTKTIPL